MVGRVREWRPHLSYVERVLDRSQRSFRSFNYYTGPKPSSQLTAAAATWALLVGPKNFSPSKAACLNGPIDKTSQTKPTTPYVSLLLQKVWIRTHQFFKFSCCIFCEYKKGKLFCNFFCGGRGLIKCVTKWLIEKGTFMKVVCNQEALPFHFIFLSNMFVFIIVKKEKMK